jgi:hypothetical protein
MQFKTQYGMGVASFLQIAPSAVFVRNVSQEATPATEISRRLLGAQALVIYTVTLQPTVQTTVQDVETALTAPTLQSSLSASLVAAGILGASTSVATFTNISPTASPSLSPVSSSSVSLHYSDDGFLSLSAVCFTILAVLLSF